MSKEIIINNPLTSGFILISTDVFERMSKYCQHGTASNESGGLILGYRRGPHLEVIDITVPLPNDISRRAYFERCDYGHESYAHERWVKSNKMIDYLGEWHTHPEDIPNPSLLDRREWLKLTRLRVSSLFFLIIGTSGVWVGVGHEKDLRCCEFYL